MSKIYVIGIHGSGTLRQRRDILERCGLIVASKRLAALLGNTFVPIQPITLLMRPSIRSMRVWMAAMSACWQAATLCSSALGGGSLTVSVKTAWSSSRHSRPCRRPLPGSRSPGRCPYRQSARQADPPSRRDASWPPQDLRLYRCTVLPGSDSPGAFSVPRLHRCCFPEGRDSNPCCREPRFT